MGMIPSILEYSHRSATAVRATATKELQWLEALQTNTWLLTSLEQAIQEADEPIPPMIWTSTTGERLVLNFQLSGEPHHSRLVHCLAMALGVDFQKTTPMQLTALLPAFDLELRVLNHLSPGCTLRKIEKTYTTYEVECPTQEVA
jgi:hypothetical protein